METTSSKTARPQRKSDLDPNFQTQISARRSDSQTMFQNGRTNSQVPWDFPPGWNGNPFDWEGMKQPFTRRKSNSDYEAAVANSMNPGNSGDIVAPTTQIEYLATMERAFRARHTYGGHQFCRGLAQDFSRKRGHGHAKGTFMTTLEYVRGILRQASG